MTRKIRTTMRPWEEVEVSDAEAVDLERQGLVHHQTPTPPTAAPAAAPRKTPAPPASGTTKEG